MPSDPRGRRLPAGLLTILTAVFVLLIVAAAPLIDAKDGALLRPVGQGGIVGCRSGHGAGGHGAQVLRRDQRLGLQQRVQDAALEVHLRGDQQGPRAGSCTSAAGPNVRVVSS